MAFEYERDEWRSAVDQMSELERVEFDRPTLTELIDVPEEDCE